MKGKMIPIKGSVFVNVEPPENQKPLPPGAHQRGWAKVATAIAADAQPQPKRQARPKSITAFKPLGDKDEVRVYRVETYSLKKTRIYTGENRLDLPERCQAYATLRNVVVHMHGADSLKKFSPQPKPRLTMKG